jgi:glycosyltransferase involved in cell wall biosynthesis
MPPIVSVVIPTYNREKDLKRALNSILAQTISYWQVLVVDNYSSDNTDDLVSSFNDSRIKLFKVNNEGVIATSRNLGIKHAEGKYIAFLDSDDSWAPNKLEVSLKYLEKGADLVFHDLFKMTKQHQKFFWRKVHTRRLKSPVFEDLISTGNIISNSSVVVRKELLDRINGLSEDTQLLGAEDFDAWLRIAKLSEKFQRIPQTLGYYWEGGNLGNPNLTLKCTAAIEKNYARTIQELYSRHSFFWLNYTKGRAYFSLKDYSMAKKFLDLNRWNRMPLLVSIKTFWMLLMIRLFHRQRYNVL